MTVPSVEVHRFVKNSREEVRTCLSEYHGHRLLDLRVFLEITGMDARSPTKKGLAVDIAMISDLRAALDAAEAKARDLGWIGGGA